MLRGVLREHPGALFYLLGCLVVGLSTIHGQAHIGDPLFALGGFVLPILLAFSLFYGGHRLDREAVTVEMAVRVFAVTLGIGALGLLIGSAVVLILQLGGQPVPEVPSLLLMAVSAGLAAGAPLGFYYYQLRSRNRELEVQYAETRTLSERLSVTQRVLRHNLRNELMVMIGITEMLIEESDGDDRTQLLKLQGHQTRLADLASTANDIRRTWETDEAVQHDLVSVVDRTVEEVRERSPQVTVTTDLPERSPVRAHPMLDRGVQEILSNAVEHTGREADITCRVLESTHEDRVRLQVADTGPGMPDEEVLALERDEETSLAHGMGLGLRLVQAVAEQSDGELSFEPNAPRGTVVNLDLPVSDQDTS